MAILAESKYNEDDIVVYKDDTDIRAGKIVGITIHDSGTEDTDDDQTMYNVKHTTSGQIAKVCEKKIFGAVGTNGSATAAAVLNALH